MDNEPIYLCGEHCMIHWVDKEIGSNGYPNKGICGGDAGDSDGAQGQVCCKDTCRKRVPRKPRRLAGYTKVGKGK